MPTFVSNQGKWYPAKEMVGLTNVGKTPIKYKGRTINPGEPFVYKGPDREAVKMLHEAGEEHLGTDFRRDPEFLQAVRNMGFQSGEQGVKDYLDAIGYDEAKEKKKFEERASVVKSHELPKKAEEIRELGGGRDTTGNKNNDLIGGFGDERARPATESSK